MRRRTEYAVRPGCKLVVEAIKGSSRTNQHNASPDALEAAVRARQWRIKNFEE